MISVFDFEDALVRLFNQNKAKRETPIAKKAGRTFYSTLTFISSKILLAKSPHLIAQNLEELVSSFRKHGLTLEIASNGLDNVDRRVMVGAMAKLAWMRNRFFYFQMIASFRSKISEEDQKFFKENSRIRELCFNTAFANYAHRIIWDKDMVAWFKNNSLKYWTAPQCASNQVLYWHSLNPKSLISCSPLTFLYSDLDYIVEDIDFETDKITELDIGLLASKLGMSKPMLRKCLLGALLCFSVDPFTKNSVSYVDSFAENSNNFEPTLFQSNEKKFNLLVSYVNQLKLQFTNDRIDESFARELASHTTLDVQDIDDHCGYYFNNIIMDKNFNAVSFPTSVTFKSSRYLLDDVEPRLIRLYFQGELLEEIIHFFSKIYNHTYILLFPKYDFVEYVYVHNVYYKEHFEWTLSKYTDIFPTQNAIEFKFQYFDSAPVKLKVLAPKSSFLIPITASATPVNLYSVIFNFYRAVQINEEFKSIQQLDKKPREDMLAYIHLVLLHQLKYIDLEKKKILVLAASLVKSGAEAWSEDLILIFEIIRHNLLMDDVIVNGESIFKNFDSFMNNNIFDEILFNDNICSIFLKNLGGVEPITTKVYKGSEISSESFMLGDSHMNSLNERLANSGDLFRIGLTKSLTVFYRTIKEFQNSYQYFFNIDKSSIKADLILNQSFDNFALKTLIVGSRVFSFIKTDFIIPDLYAIDMIQFKQILNAVQRSLCSVVNSSKIRFLYQSSYKLTENFLDSIKNSLPFRKNYSVDGGKLFKIIATRFLIYQALCLENDLFAKIYAKSFSTETLRNSYNIDFCLKDYFTRGKEFIDKLICFLACVREMSQSLIYIELTHQLNELSCLVAKIREFFMHQ
jgi:hypothetical protein